MFRRHIFSAFVVLLFFGLWTGRAEAVLFNASGVLGQPDYVTKTATPPNDVTSETLNKPIYSVLDTTSNHRLFLSDQTNRRVLVFSLNSDSTISTTTASYVLGQPDFVNSGDNTTQNGLQNGVHGVAYDATNDRLFVADLGNNRVLVFNVASGVIANGENASYVLGQADFTSNVTATTQSGLGTLVRGVAYDSDNKRLFVTDASNHRVLVFNVDPATIANGENASYVLGQANFTTGSATTTQSGMNSPAGLAMDVANQRLFVTERTNNRILVFNVAPGVIANGENASYVLGQANFTASSSAVTQSGFNLSRGVAYDSVHNLIYVADSNNNRVMVFDVDPTTIANGANAVNVLGQADFTTSTSHITQSGFEAPGNPSIDSTNNVLYVSDSQNYRVLMFSLIKISTTSLAAGGIGNAYSQTVVATSTQGTVTFSLASGTLPTGLSLDTNTGVISGTPTTATSSTFTIRANDTSSTGSFFDQASYTIVVTDTTAPTVALNAPQADDRISSSVTLTAEASDNVALSSLYFQIDGTTVGTVGSASPYSITWDSTSVANGSHSISAIAADTSGNTATSSISVTVDNTTTSSSGGRGFVAPLSTNNLSLSPIIFEKLVAFLTLVSKPSTLLSKQSDLTLQSEGAIVRQLQSFLVTQDHGPAARALQQHGLTNYFGPLTQAALAEYQASVDISPPVGYFGPRTRAHLESIGY